MAGALAGTTVLELTRVSPGSFCTMILADMGADVLKIETPPALSPESGSGMSARTERQAAFSYVNRNKRSLGLNLKAPEGQAILHQLATGGRCAGRRFSTRRDAAAQRRLCDLESAQSTPGLLLAQRLWPGRPVSRPSGPRPQLPCHQWRVKPHW